jgi:thiol-disulfide isomerase/thioredoxin
MRARLPLLILPTLPTLLALSALSSLSCARGKGGAVAHPQGDADVRQVAVIDTDGRPATLSSVLGGRPGLVSLWAPWCEPCVRELPELERLSRALAPCGGAVVGVAVGEKPAAIAYYTRARHLDYPQLSDETFALADALGQRRIPATVVFDAPGRVVFTGDALDARAIAALSRALAQHASAKPCALP